jgi:hypothetical protein
MFAVKPVRIFGLAILVLLAGCDSQAGKSDADRASTGATTEAPLPPSLLPPSVLDVPPAKMRHAMHNSYRLKPDNRFMFAIGDIDYLITGRDKKKPVAVFREGQWRISYDGEIAGSMPEFPDFEDAVELLQQWTRSRLQGQNMMLGPQERADGSLADARPFEAHDLLGWLGDIDSRWQRGKRHRGDLQKVAKALTRACSH